MKKFKRLRTAIVLSLTLAMVTPVALPAVKSTIVAQAATISLNKKTATVAPGKTVLLNLTGTKAKVTWTSSEKTVASVDQKGKVTAKKAGKTTITATANNKKYTCEVTVKESASSAKAPFKTKNTTYKGYQYAVPSSWVGELDKNSGMMTYNPSKKTPNAENSSMNVFVERTGLQISYNSLKEIYVTLLKEQLGDVVKNAKTTKLNSKLGDTLKIELTIEESGEKGKVVCYVISTKDDLIQIMSMDANKKVDPSAEKVAEYVFKSIKAEK